MGKQLVEITGFKEVEQLIKRLPDKVKKREINKILMQVAQPTLVAARRLAPVSKKVHIQKRKGQAFGKYITPGTGKKSLAKKVMTRSKNALVTVSPRSRKSADGFYLRQFVIPGTKHIKGNNFIDKAEQQTKGLVTADAEKKVSKFIQKQINRLSS